MRHELVFQPIVDLRQGLVTGYEALSRFPNEMGHSTEVVLQRAEVEGKRLELEYLLCAKALAARARLPQNCFLSVNVSPQYLLSEWWQRTIGLVDDLAGVVVEITEETSISNYGDVRDRETQIRSMGGLVAVDDAGAGYASMQHIIELRPDFIKLDRTFVHDCHLDPAKMTMVEMLGAAADKLDAWVIAEGVELVEELEELIRIDVPLAQGYLLGRPQSRMQGVSAKVSEQLQRRNTGNRISTMEPHMSVCAICTTAEMADNALKDYPDYTAAVIVDQWRRPVRILERHPLVGERLLDVFMRVQVASNPRQVLHRVIGREPEKRFDPVVVINNEGACVGVVEVHRLVSMVLALGEQKGG
jgi:EAL domain-containing protein (putative c-di-GMP-specific phosphodiesterase class I)